MAVPFDKPSVPLGDHDDALHFIEYIDPAAFDDSINNNDDIMLLYSHEWDKPLARRSAGRLTIEKRADGIYYKATPPDTTIAQDLIKDIEAGNIVGNSFAFTVEQDEWTRRDDNVAVRRILKGKLYEISPVVSPAYPDTSIAKRSLDATRKHSKQSLSALKRKLEIVTLKSKIN